MDGEKRIVEVRLIVLVLIDVTDPAFTEYLAVSESKRVADVVSSEIVSNLESVSYVESVIATEL